MDVLGILSAFGLSASAGLNAYIPLLVVALIAKFTPLMKLNPPYDALTSWWIIGLLGTLATVEFFADKVPAVNHVNDVVQTFIRPTAGAILFAASAKVVTDLNPILSIAAGVLVAGSIHLVKAAVIRPAVTATTAGAGNIPVSLVEDLTSTAVSIIAALVPVVIAVILVMIAAWIILRMWRRAKASPTV
jgi:hypothetical protein